MSQKQSRMSQRVLDKNRPPANEFYGVKEISQNTFWDDARTTHDTMVQSWTNIDEPIAEAAVEVIQDPALLAQVPNQAKFLNAIVAYDTDFRAHSERVDAIYQRHANRSGGTKNGNEHIELLKINEDYANAQLAYERLILPHITTIKEQLGVFHGAQQELLQLAAPQASGLTPAQDPNVITDVVLAPAGV